jgi:hypothetical protein
MLEAVWNVVLIVLALTGALAWSIGILAFVSIHMLNKSIDD